MMPPLEEKPESIEGSLPILVRVTLGNLVCGEGRVAIGDAQPADAAGCAKPGVLPLAGHAAIHLRQTSCHHCAEEFSRHLGLPRGCRSRSAESHGVGVELADEGFPGRRWRLLFMASCGPIRTRRRRCFSS